MVDTGAAPNVIKKRSLHPEAVIKRDDTLFLSGITNGRVETLGSVEIFVMGHPVTLHVVPDNFPIAQEGILGSDFLRDASTINLSERYVEWQGTKIPFSSRETIVIPARSQAAFYLKVNNPQIKIGYVPRLRVCEGVFLGEAVVANREGKAYVHVINSNNEDRELTVPEIDLQEIEQISDNGPLEVGRDSDINVIRHETKAERVERIRQTLRLDHLNSNELKHVSELIEKNHDLFQLPGEQLGCTTITEHKIVTSDEQPINTKQYRFPPVHKDEINRQVNDMLKNDIIKTSTSPYNSPLWIVPKKADSKGNKRWRLVIDFRALNEKTLGDAYPLPNISDILDQIGSAKYFSVFDLASGFHQIPMSEADAPKTAFSTPFGHYEYKRMPFGLKNAPATFQRLMDRVLSGLQGIELFVYLDDIVIYASSLTEHNRKFHKLAERLRSANLRLQPDKCEFLRKEVTYLGHVINETGVKPDPKKVEAVLNFPRPKNVKNIKQFLGLAGYYRRFLNNFSKTARPLTALLKKDEPFVWQEPQETAFVTLRNQLCTEPLLQHPDFTRPFVLTTDASGYAIGGILSQGDVGKDKPIAYASRLLNKAEQNYSTIEKESLAIVYCVNHFRPYLYGNKFTIVTDHKPLEWLHSVKNPTSRLVRWRLKLAEYEYNIMYKAGKSNCNADALSRNPTETHASHDKIIFQEDNAKQRHMFPLEQCSTDDESLFNAKLSNRDSDETAPDNDACDKQPPLETPTQPQTPDIISTLELDSDEETETFSSTSGSESDDALFDNPNEPYAASLDGRTQFYYSRANITSRKDNLVIFITQSGEPCDEGARALAEAGTLPQIKDATLGRARPVPRGRNKYTIALTISEKTSGIIERETLNETIYSLLDVIKELDIKTFSICRGPVGSVPWESIYAKLDNILNHARVDITVCTNAISSPPLDKRQEIITECHASAIGGHKGMTKTYRRVKDKYYWPGMKADIQNFIQRCRNCQLKKLVRRKTKQPMVLTDTPDAAFDKVSMDIMGPLPVSRNENAYILTIQDLLTKYSLAIPLQRASAIDVANAFVNNFICIYGAPKALLTDQGTHFLNSLMKAIAKRFKISRYTTTAYRPQANGAIERSHHVLWEYLKQVVGEKNDWDEYLSLACFSYNTSVHEGTQYTPHELVFGKLARVPSSEILPEDVSNESYADYLTTLYNRIKDTQEIARTNLQRAKERSKRYYDKKIKPCNFNKGDLVYLLKEPTTKLGNQYTGPYRILEILGNNNVRLEISAKSSRTVHSDKLKPAPTNDHPRGGRPYRPSEKTAGSSASDFG